MNQRTHPEHGFSLIELLIVIVILGVLAGIVVFAMSNMTDDAHNNACATDQSSYQGAVEAFRVHSPTRAYPTQDSDVVGAYVKNASRYWTVTANTPDRVQARGGVTLPSGCVNDPNA